MPPGRTVSRAMPAGSRSPTGRTPQERSREPQLVSGLTFSSLPLTLIVPLQEPICASRWVSNVIRLPCRMNWLGSGIAGPKPSHVRSQATA